MDIDWTFLDSPAFPVICIGLLALFFLLVVLDDVKIWRHGPHKCFKGHWEVAKDGGRWVKSWICEKHHK